MAFPNIKKDANGNFYVEGIKEREISQQQFDYNNIVQSAQFLTGPEGDAARQAITQNPNISAGVVAGLYKNGNVGSSALVDTFVEIDKQTAARRARDELKEAQRISDEKFDSSFRGKAYKNFKGLIRNAGLALFTPIENWFAGIGNNIGMVAKEFQLTAQGKLTWDGKPTDPNETRESLGLLSEKDMLNAAINPLVPIKQTTLFQAGKQQIEEGKVDLGRGFFPSEEIGAGFKARQERMKYAKIAVTQNGEQVLDSEGNPLYRPYSPVDPVSFVITRSLGLDDSNARLINAIGELGLMVVADPATAYARAAKLKKQLEQAKAFNAGVLPGKEMQRLTMLETQVDEAQKAVEESLAQMNVFNGQTTGQKIENYRKALADQTKIELEYTTALNKEINYEPIAAFLSGSSGSHIIDAIANLDDWKQIWSISKKGGKSGFTVEQAKVLAAATNREEVLKAIAPYIASGNVAQNILETGNTTSRFLSKITPGFVARPAEGIAGWAAKGIRRVPIIQKQLTALSQSYSTYVPLSGAFVHYADKDALIETIVNYGRSTKVDEKTINSIIDEVAYATDPSTAGYSAVTKLFDSIFEANKAAFAKAGINESELRQLTRVFDNEHKEHSKYWAELHATDASIDFAYANGKKITFSGAHLDSEFLNSMVYFPSATDLMSELRKIGKFGSVFRNKAVGSTLNAADIFTNNFWKKVILTRPAYVIRNISEEQIRVMATGHVSFFTNPAVAIGMWLGREGGPKWKSLLNSFDPYRHTVFGSQFKMANSADELMYETMAHGQIEEYIGFMSNEGLGAARETQKISSLRGYKNVQQDEPRFWEGIANEIRILQASPIAKAVARTQPGREQATIDYLLRGQGKDAWTRFTSTRDEKVKNWLLTDEGARIYLFDGVTENGRAASLRARIEEVAGQGGPSSAGIRKLIAEGSLETAGFSLRVPTASDSAINSIKNSKEISKNKKSIKDANIEFADQLKKVFSGQGNWEGLRFKVSDPKTIIQRGVGGPKFVDDFFDWTVRLEKTTTMGPEWRMKYWDIARTMALSADANALKVLKETAEKSLRPLVNPNGVRIGDKHAAWDILNKAKGDGPLTIDEIHEYASKVASQHTKELFYNAAKKRLFWHQLRLVAPFGNAWGDTIQKWSRLSFDNPDQVYKISRGLDWLKSPESSALYEITDAKDYYDPNQGFFFTDPQSGQRNFFVPFMSTGMNFFSNLARGDLSLKGPFATGASPQSFNFALGSGIVLPGFGPGIALSLTILDSLGKNPLDKLPPAWKDDLYKVVFPFGQADLSVGSQAVGSITSGNIGRVFGAITGSEESYAASFAPVMNYLATSGDYNIDDPADQSRLIADTNDFAQYFMLMRGLFGFVSPVAIQPKNLTNDKDGDLLLASSLYSDFRTLEIAAGSNRNKAYADFLDLYGPEQIFAIISKTSGGPNSLYTYELIQRDPSVVNEYSDVYGYFYPNGGFSQELYRWQMRNQKRERLTSQEILEKATNIRYYAARDRVLARSVGEGWDSKRTEKAISNLGDSYELRNRKVIFDVTKEPRIFAQLEKAAYDERFLDSEAVTGLRDYLLLRQKAIEASGRVSLNNKSSLPQREWLAEQALQLIKKYPDFQKVYYSFLKRELEG